MLKHINGGREALRAVAGLVVAAGVLGGCVVVAPTDTHVNYAPYIDDAFVTCAYDPTYDSSAWDFYAQVYDDNGPLDVRNVYVDVIDLAYDPYSVAETWSLAYDIDGQWSNTIYEDNGSGNPYDYSQVLDCYYYYSDYEFDFYAIDSYNDRDSVTFIPY